jgi:hypothetical protein
MAARKRDEVGWAMTHPQAENDFAIGFFRGLRTLWRIHESC